MAASARRSTRRANRLAVRTVPTLRRRWLPPLPPPPPPPPLLPRWWRRCLRALPPPPLAGAESWLPTTPAAAAAALARTASLSSAGHAASGHATYCASSSQRSVKTPSAPAARQSASSASRSATSTTVRESVKAADMAVSHARARGSRSPRPNSAAEPDSSAAWKYSPNSRALPSGADLPLAPAGRKARRSAALSPL